MTPQDKEGQEEGILGCSGCTLLEEKVKQLEVGLDECQKELNFVRLVFRGHDLSDAELDE